MPSHIEKRRNLWYAHLKITDKSVQERLGRTKFSKSLGTSNRQRALILAAPIVAMWKAQMRQAGGELDAVQDEALRWREAMTQARRDGDQEQLDLVQDLIRHKSDELEERKGQHVADRFADVALSRVTPSSEHLAAWKASIAHLAQKSQDQAGKDVERLVARFPTLEAMTPLAARQWLEALDREGVSPSSVKRMIVFWRSYWRYLGSIAAVSPGSFPFSVEMVRKTSKAERKDEGWIPFAPADVPKLLAAAKAKRRKDQPLVDLI